jgi:molecular chaperone DnaK (HSP70)
MLSFDPQPQRIIAYGIDLGTTHSTLCRVSLEPDACRPEQPEPVTLPQPTPAGTRYSDFLPSMVARSTPAPPSNEKICGKPNGRQAMSEADSAEPNGLDINDLISTLAFFREAGDSTIATG